MSGVNLLTHVRSPPFFLVSFRARVVAADDNQFVLESVNIQVEGIKLQVDPCVVDCGICIKLYNQLVFPRIRKAGSARMLLTAWSGRVLSMLAQM